jgi:hypothetical protein
MSHCDHNLIKTPQGIVCSNCGRWAVLSHPLVVIRLMTIKEVKAAKKDGVFALISPKE